LASKLAKDVYANVLLRRVASCDRAGVGEWTTTRHAALGMSVGTCGKNVPPHD